MALKVDAAIPYGNAGDAAVDESLPVPEVSFAADPHGGPEALWFCFRLLRDGPDAGGARVRLVLKHFLNLLGCGRDQAANLRPVLRRAGGGWERLGPAERLDLPDGRVHLAWTVPAPDPWIELAMCYPYGRPEVEELVRGSGGAWRAEAIGLSQAGRPLLRLANGPGQPGSSRPGLYLVARQHSGETPGSWVLDGFLRQVAALGDKAPLVWTVPLANTDGVEQGDYGKDNFPYDLNRAWGKNPMRHETLAIQRDLRRWQERCRPALGIDFHAPGGCEADGAYCFGPDPYEDLKLYREAQAWIGAARQALGPEYASADFDRLATYTSRWETPTFTGHCIAALALASFSVETSYQMAPGGRVLAVEDYREIGRRMARGVCGRLAELDRAGAPGV
jgi:hypothetical protein